MNKIGIIGTGSYTPPKVVSNADLEKIVKNYDAEKGKGSLDEWVRRRYGISERRWAAADELPSDMATEACRNAIQKAGLTPSDIDFLILNTAYGDYHQPTTATSVQRNLGMRSDTFALEVNLPCGGPVFGLSVAHNFILSGRYKYGIVVGVDKMSLLIDQEDFRMVSLFGEAAGACILGAVETGGIIDYHLGSKGEEGAESEYALVIPGGRAAHPSSPKTVEEKLHFLYMNGGIVDDFIQTYFTDTIRLLLERNQLDAQNFGYLVPHQAARNSILKNTQKAGIPDEKVFFTLEKFGNTSSASILLTLDHAMSQNLPQGSHLLLVGMGGGLNWGGVLIQI